MIIGISLIISILVPIIIDIKAPNKTSEITADGLLEYIVSCVSATVTAALTIYAFCQTNKANKIAEQANEDAKKANRRADELMEQANNIANQANEDAKKANERADKLMEQANKIAEQANEATKNANERADKLMEQANKIAEQSLEIESISYRLQIRPFITVTKYETGIFSMNDISNPDNQVFICVGDYDKYISEHSEEDDECDIYGVILTVTNTTNSFITVKYDLGYSDNDDNGLDYCVTENNIPIERISLNAGECAEIVLWGESELWISQSKHIITLEFILENHLMQIYKEKFDVNCIDIYENNDGELKCFFDFNNYHIYKKVNKNGKKEYIEEKL